MIYVTADTHFGHDNIIGYCKRPFKTQHEMDQFILDKINSVVRPQDVLYHLGDFSWSGTVNYYRDKIMCRNLHLILGNHDKDDSIKRAVKIDANVFTSIGHMAHVKWNHIKFLMCHYPIQYWRRGYIHLHGHSHGNCENKPGRYDVGVDVGYFADPFCPISLEVICDYIKKWNPIMLDHGMISSAIDGSEKMELE